MTGQVKEDILSRIGELGVFVENGQLLFKPCLLRDDEFLITGKAYNYVDIKQNWKHIDLEKGSLAFTYCQVPIVYKTGNEDSIDVIKSDQSVSKFDTLSLDKETSHNVFTRSGLVDRITVNINKSTLK